MTVAIKDTAAFIAALGCGLPDADGYITPLTQAGSHFVVGFDPDATLGSFEGYKLRPTAVLYKSGGALSFWAFNKPVPTSEPGLLTVVAALGMAGVDEPLPTPGVNYWSLEHSDIRARYPLSALIAAYVAVADGGPTAGPGGASAASDARDRNDLAMANILTGLGIDPANAYLGFRARHPFPVAVRLAMLGFRVMPSRVDTKVPYIGGWPKQATTDPAKLALWQRRYNPNWSILTGRENNLVLLDVDGEQGRADLAGLEAKLGKLPRTVVNNSGRLGGGCHILLRPPAGNDDLRNQQPLTGTKIDVRGWHGHGVIAGSLHKSGQRYSWASGCAPDEVEIAECPPAWWEWLPKKNEEKSVVAREARSGVRAPAIKQKHDPSSLLIGDGEGFGGFQNPIYKNAIRYFLNVGVSASEAIIIETLREMIAEAPKAEGRDVSRYMEGDDLPRTVDRAREYVKQMKGK